MLLQASRPPGRDAAQLAPYDNVLLVEMYIEKCDIFHTRDFTIAAIPAKFEVRKKPDHG
jgi:hypothetical protein